MRKLPIFKINNQASNIRYFTRLLIITVFILGLGLIGNIFWRTGKDNNECMI